MSNRFHLAIPVTSIEKAKTFYCDLLGCVAGNFEEGKWQDVNFWGNELTLHEANEVSDKERHHVDMGAVCVPHFGVHLDEDVYMNIKEAVSNSEKGFLDDPYRRFIDDPREQETFFVEDPSGNVLEIKTMKNPETLWEV
ncbi:MAG: extradiol dioxygenase family protein [Gammaproteobacteria bacterium]|jgi:extradiol dioxygenase family protein|tara:strand:+ start:2837 stop:3253 length:417 start_codon:yes stop_codon:yes gene_type:complete